MNPQVLCQYTLSPRSPCVPLVGPSGAKYADRDTILPEVCVCVLVSDVIYVTSALPRFGYERLLNNTVSIKGRFVLLVHCLRFWTTSESCTLRKYLCTDYIRSSEKCLSFTDTSFTTTHLYTNMKPNDSNVVIFILIKQNGSYRIR